MVNYAALDFGSNSTRVLIASVENGELNKISKKHIVTKMAEGISSSGDISENALTRVTEAVSIFFEEINKHEVGDTFAVGTSAMRDSKNSLEIKKYIKEKFNLDIEVISGTEEAKLTLDGALYDFPEDQRTILFDIGGGSTEVIYRDQQTVSSTSYQLGVVRISEEALPSRPVVDVEEKRAVELIDSLLSQKFSIVSRRFVFFIFIPSYTFY